MLVQTWIFAKVHQRHPRPPPPRRKTGRASSPFSGGAEPRGKLQSPESGRWIWWERKKIGAYPSSFPPSDPTSTATGAGTTRNAGENSLLKETFPGAKRTQWKPLTIRAGPLVSRLCMLHSQSDHAQTVCIPARWCSVGREESTICNVTCFRPYVPLTYGGFLCCWNCNLTNNSK